MWLFPEEVLTVQATGSALPVGFAFQAAWLALAVILYRVIWRKGLRRYAAVGG